MYSYLVGPYRPGMSKEGNGLLGWTVEYFSGSDFPFFTDFRYYLPHMTSFFLKNKIGVQFNTVELK
jgi:hypothetical protein